MQTDTTRAPGQKPTKKYLAILAGSSIRNDSRGIAGIPTGMACAGLRPPNPDIVTILGVETKARPLHDGTNGHHPYRREHPGWREQHPTGPVTWDLRCQRCGLTVEDYPHATDARVNGQTICARENGQMLCTSCAPLTTNGGAQ